MSEPTASRVQKSQSKPTAAALIQGLLAREMKLLLATIAETRTRAVAPTEPPVKKENVKTLSSYLEKLHGLVDVHEHLGGKPGTSRARIKALMDANISLTEEKVKAMAREEHVAILLVAKSDPHRHGSLVADIVNDHARGFDGYPKTVSTAYNMLVNYKTHARKQRHNNHEGGMSFLNDSTDDRRSGSSGGRGRGSGGRSGGRNGGRGGNNGGRGGRGGNTQCSLL